MMTAEATEYWSKREKKQQITIEEWLSKAPPEVRERPNAHTPSNNYKPLGPGVMDEVLGTPIWHESREAQTPKNKPENGYTKLWMETA